MKSEKEVREDNGKISKTINEILKKIKDKQKLQLKIDKHNDKNN